MTDRVSRRAFLVGAGLAGLAAAGMADGALDPALAWAATNGPGRNGISTATPKRGGSIVYGTDSEAQGFDPTTAEWDETGYTYARTVMDPLVAATKSGGWIPYLAQSVTPNADYTSWSITLRPNVTFHDGTPCDGAALLTNLQKQMTSALVGPVFADLVSDVSQTGPLSVRLDMTKPWVTFPYQLTGQTGYVAAPSMLKNPNGTDHPVGTGPFVYQQWQQNQRFVATRNPSYWRQGYPYLQQITYKPIVDDVARSDALQSGTIDMMVTVTPQIIIQYRGNRQWSYADDNGPVVGEPQVNLIQLNVSQPPMDQANVRLAMAKSFSQQAVSKILTEGVNTPISGPFIPGTPYYSKTGYPVYDPSGARTLVKQYQKQTGKPLAFTLSTTPDPEVQRTATYLQQQWSNSGINVQLATYEQNELISNVVSGKYQATTWRQFGQVQPDLNYVFWSAQTVNKNGLSLNLARNEDPRIQAALETGRQTTDQSVRAKAYQQIGEYFAQDLPYLWLGRAVWAIVAAPKVQNFYNPIGPAGQHIVGLESGITWPTQLWLT